jgi:hypothetical protein
MEPFIWNLIIENNLEDCESRHTIALPLNNHISLPPPVAAAMAVVAITPILMGHKKHKLNEIELFLPFLDDDNVEMLYPHLSSALVVEE